MKNAHIYERKGKKGVTLQIKIPYFSAGSRRYFSQSLKVSDYPSKTAAYVAARMIRDQAMVDINNQRMYESLPTVGALYKRYWEIARLSIKTRRFYDRIYVDTVAPLADRVITDVDPAEIQYLLSLYAEEKSQRLVNSAKYIWQKIYLTAQMSGLDIADKTVQLMPVVSRVPAKKIKRENVVTYDDFVRFTEVLLEIPSRSPATEKRKHDIWYLLWIMYYTGCRPAEVLALEASDIDFDAMELRIEKSVGSTRTDFRQIVATKRPASFRRIPISEGLEAVLRDLLNYSSSSPLLCAYDGLPYEITDITNGIVTVEQKTGIKFNSYQLRRMFSDTLFDAAINPVVIRDLMGHTSTSMSLYYAKATPAQMKAAIKKASGDGGSGE